MFEFAAGIAVGGLVGAWFYRYMVKRNPAKLEAWAAEAKAAGNKAKDRLDA